ncbi:MAG: hypothetical protein IT429_13460 [Gemmataceae bacterium]|nr:hypothetical protein [Gemmataceae bacterium]
MQRPRDSDTSKRRHWEDKVEVWQEETSLPETTLAKIRKRCGESVPE